MKKSLTKMLLLFGLLGLVSTLNYSCKTGEGCPAEMNYKEEQERAKNGEVPKLSTKRGKSGLWSKKQKKRNKR